MLKNAYFLEKTVKISSASGGPPPNPRLLPAEPSRVVTSGYYYRFVKSLFLGVNAFYYPQIRTK